MQKLKGILEVFQFFYILFNNMKYVFYNILCYSTGFENALFPRI
jgi:hypothetical protein